MDARELRIGNYIQYFGNVVQVEGIVNESNGFGLQLNGGDFASINSNSLEHDPLTEEWLLRFGFVKEVEYKKKINFSRFHLFQISASNPYNDNENEFKVNFYQSKQCVELCRIKYVHQLQNLYFALTGEELTLKTK